MGGQRVVVMRHAPHALGPPVAAWAGFPCHGLLDGMGDWMPAQPTAPDP